MNDYGTIENILFVDFNDQRLAAIETWDEVLEWDNDYFQIEGVIE